ncbi:hypothetical protein [Streptomyces sp. NPDC057623]|uniref:hypothetical protein n=1 Tax=Streptomyces sp. NPDC057623 TaxID=3346187 RepID=UPI00367FD540
MAPASCCGRGIRLSGVIARSCSRRPFRQSARDPVSQVAMNLGVNASTRTVEVKAAAY